jgi:hypothetical protein
MINSNTSTFPSILTGTPFLLNGSAVSPRERDTIAMLHRVLPGTTIIGISSPFPEWRVAGHSEMVLFSHHTFFTDFIYSTKTQRNGGKRACVVGGIIYDYTSIYLREHWEDGGNYISMERKSGHTHENGKWTCTQAEECSYLLLVKTV